MAIRSGMQNLVNRLRVLTGAGTAEYVAGAVTYWTDDHLQAVLDSNNQYVGGAQLQWQPETIGGGTVAYYEATLPRRDMEEAESGTTRWVIRDSIGGTIGTANYTADYRAGRVRFAADQHGSAYYLTGYTYDVYAAASDLWGERLSNFASYYDFKSDNQTLTRSQIWEHARDMQKLMMSKAGANAGQGELHTGVFYRSDLRG
jgi:hypothetical protein